jgi:hypothetical protein
MQFGWEEQETRETIFVAKMDLKETDFSDLDWLGPVWNWTQLQKCVSAVLNLFRTKATEVGTFSAV